MVVDHVAAFLHRDDQVFPFEIPALMIPAQLSHVLEAIHAPEEYAKGTIRISLGYENTEEEITHIAASLMKILKH